MSDDFKFDWSSFLGGNLLKKDGPEADKKVATNEALEGAEYVALYFSAHWCPPCRRFTPKLAEFYKKMNEQAPSEGTTKRLEIVFVSSDENEESMSSYFKESHGDYFALPFADRDQKKALSKKFKVQGIPSLKILDGKTGELVNGKGVGKVYGDEEGASFPWRPKTFTQILAGKELLKKDAEGAISKFTFEELQASGKKYLGIYLSAHWCPPCRRFTPKLAATYKTLQEKGGLDDFEILFVSSDRDEAAFDEYYGEMPWTALSYEARSAKAELGDLLDCEGIPQFTIVELATGKVVRQNAVSAVGADPEGKELPWLPKPVNDIEQVSGDINEIPTLVAFMHRGEVTEGERDRIKGAMVEVAKEHNKEGEEKKMAFYYVNKMARGTIADRVMQLVGTLKKGKNGVNKVVKDTVTLICLDIDNGKFFQAPTKHSSKIDAGAIRAFLADKGEAINLGE